MNTIARLALSAATVCLFSFIAPRLQAQALPHAIFIADIDSGAAPLTVQFTDKSVPEDSIQSWEWDFDGDGMIDSRERHPSHTYEVPGKFDVTLIIHLSWMSDTVTYADFIEVAPVHEADITCLIRVHDFGGPDVKAVELWGYETGGGLVPTSPFSTVMPLDTLGQAVFHKYKFLKLLNQDITDLLLLDAQGRVIGKIGFSFTYKDFVAGRRKDAIVFVHNELTTYRNHPVDQAGNSTGNNDWLFARYVRFPYKPGATLQTAASGDAVNGEMYQVSMLIPPAQQDTSSADWPLQLLRNVRADRTPVLLLHGAGGTDGYWGANADVITRGDLASANFNGKRDYTITSTAGRLQRHDFDQYDRFDVWEYYFPPDQSIDGSALMFAYDLKVLLASYNGLLAGVAAHGEGGLLLRSYIEGTAANYDRFGSRTTKSYDYDIYKAVYLGTPHSGTLGAAASFGDVFGGNAPAFGVRDPAAPVWRDLTPGSLVLNSTNRNPLPPPIPSLGVAGTAASPPAEAWTETEQHDNNALSLISSSLLHRGGDLGLLAGYSQDMLRDPDTPYWTVSGAKRGLVAELVHAYMLSDTTLAPYLPEFAAFYTALAPSFPQVEFTPPGMAPFRIDMTLPVVDFEVDGGRTWRPLRNLRLRYSDDGGAVLQRELVDGVYHDHGDAGMFLYPSANDFSGDAFKQYMRDNPFIDHPSGLYGTMRTPANNPLTGTDLAYNGLGWHSPAGPAASVQDPWLAVTDDHGQLYKFFRARSQHIPLTWMQPTYTTLDISRQAELVLNSGAFRSPFAVGDSTHVQVDCSQESVTFILSYGNSPQPVFTLQAPDDSVYTMADADDSTLFHISVHGANTFVFTLVKPLTGRWKLLINNAPLLSSSTWRVAVSATQPHEATLALSPVDVVNLDSVVVSATLDDPASVLSGYGAQATVRDMVTDTETALQLRDDGVAPDPVAGDGMFHAWWQPTSPSDYRIEAELSADNGSCTVRGQTFVDLTVPPRLRLLAPLAGTEWRIGTTQQVRWDGVIPDYVTLEYSSNGGSSWMRVATNVEASLGSYDWMIPPTPTLDARFRITDASDPALSDESGSFTLYTVPTVTVLAPLQDDDWRVYSQQEIRWTDVAVDSVYIMYSLDDGVNWEVITGSVPSDPGSYTWTVPDAPSDRCRIRIASMTDGTAYDVSGRFRISAFPALRVLTPNGGERWLEGTKQQISWYALEIDAVDLELSTDDGTSWRPIISDLDPSISGYLWTVPSTISDRCRIRASGMGDTLMTDVSDGLFSIVPIPAITLTAPNGGEQWLIDSVETIRWNSTGIQNIDIEYSMDMGATWRLIAGDVDATTGRYDWTIPDTPAEFCLARVSSTIDTSLRDQSDNYFSISEAQTRVTLLFPVNNDTEVALETTLRWLRFDAAQWYRVQLTTDPSFNTFIVDSTAITGTSMLTPQLQPGRKYYWRVRAERDNWNGEWSAEWNFTTGDATLDPPELDAPFDGSIGLPTSSNLRWNAVDDAFTYRVQVAQGADFSNPLHDQGGLTSTSFVASGLSHNADYRWRVMALGDGSIARSDWSDVWTFSTAPGAPSHLAPLKGLADVAVNPLMQWRASTDARMYRLQLSRREDFSTVERDTGSITSTAIRLYGLASFTTYYWRMTVTTQRGTSDWSEPWFFRTIDIGTDVGSTSLPLRWQLGQNHPNPATGVTTVRFDAAEKSDVRIAVLDLLGRELFSVDARADRPGRYTVQLPLGSLQPGMYLYRLSAGEVRLVRKMLVL